MFGGGPIVGVVSTSKDKTIRVFNKKDKYNQWQFTYDPTMDTGALINGPNVGLGTQQVAGFGTPINGNQNGNQNGQQQSGFGFSGGSPFGGSPGGQQPVPVEQPSPYPQQPQQPQFPPEQGPQ